MGGKGSKEEKGGRGAASRKSSKGPARAPSRSAAAPAPTLTREQMIEAEDRYGDVHALETYHRDPADRKFRVTDITDETTKVEGFIVCRYPDLLFIDTNEHQEQMKWSIKYLRGYGQNDGLFSFETGRKCPFGSKVYFFEVKDDNVDIFAELNLIVESYNHGVGGDRYDHIPAGGTGGPNGGMETYAVADHGSNRRSNADEQETYAVANHGGGGGGGAQKGDSGDIYSVAQHNKGGGGDDQETYAVANHSQSSRPVYGGDSSNYATAVHGGGSNGGGDLYATANHSGGASGGGGGDMYATANHSNSNGNSEEQFGGFEQETYAEAL